MEKRVSNRQLFFIIFIVLTGYSIIALPKTMANSAGTGAWIPILITTILFSFTISIIISLNNMFKNKTLFEYSTQLVGKIITYCFTIIYIIYFFGIATMLLRSNAELVKLDLLPKTPIWATIFITVFFCTYSASKGLSNLGRILEFFGTIIITFYIGINITMWLKGDMLDIQPIFNKDEISSYIKAIPLTFMPFLGAEVVTMIPLTNKNKKAIWYVVGAIISAGILYIVVVMGTYSILGVEDTGNYMNPFLVAVRRIEVEMLQFLKRLDVFAFIVWIFALFCLQIMLIYVISEYTSKLFSKSKGKIVLIVLAVLAFIVALIPNNMKTVEVVFTYLTLYFGIVPALLIPLTLFIVAKVKKNVEKNI